MGDSLHDNRVSRIATRPLVEEFDLITLNRTFPGFFIVWPDVYEWSGTLRLANGAQFVAPTSGSTAPLRSNPQPTNAQDISILSERLGFHTTRTITDPRGLSYSLITDGGDYWQFSAFSHLFPDQPAITTCFDGGAGPDWAGFTQTNWMTVSSTSYIGSSLSTATAKASQRYVPSAGRGLVSQSESVNGPSNQSAPTT
jgi:hypothetical protein